MKLKDFTRYADSMKEVATEIAPLNIDLDEVRMRRAQQMGGISPMMQMMQAQQQVNMQQHDALQREYSTGGLFSALGGLFRGL